MILFYFCGSVKHFNIGNACSVVDLTILKAEPDCKSSRSNYAITWSITFFKASSHHLYQRKQERSARRLPGYFNVCYLSWKSSSLLYGLDSDLLEFQIQLYMCFESFSPDWLFSTAVGTYFVSHGQLFSKTQKGQKSHEGITSVLFQAPHEYIVQIKYRRYLSWFRRFSIIDHRPHWIFMEGTADYSFPDFRAPVPCSPFPVLVTSKKKWA